jgi:hypothetical protein
MQIFIFACHQTHHEVHTILLLLGVFKFRLTAAIVTSCYGNNIIFYTVQFMNAFPTWIHKLHIKKSAKSANTSWHRKNLHSSLIIDIKN